MTDETNSTATPSDDDTTADETETASAATDSEAHDDEGKPSPRDTRYRQRLREAEATLQAERQAWEQQRTEMQATIAEYRRADIARETGVPVEEVVGETVEEMRESTRLYRQRIDAAVERELKARNIGPAAPASAVTSDGKPGHEQAPSDWTDAFRPRV